MLLLAALALAPLEVIAQSPFVVPEPSAAARDWSRHRDLLWLVEQALAVGLAALLLFSRRGAELRTRLDRITRAVAGCSPRRFSPASTPPWRSL